MEDEKYPYSHDVAQINLFQDATEQSWPYKYLNLKTQQINQTVKQNVWKRKTHCFKCKQSDLKNRQAVLTFQYLSKTGKYSKMISDKIYK